MEKHKETIGVPENVPMIDMAPELNLHIQKKLAMGELPDDGNTIRAVDKFYREQDMMQQNHGNRP